jgi:hypothetical protein
MPAIESVAAVAEALLRSEAGAALLSQRWSVLLPGGGGAAHVAAGGKVTSEAAPSPPLPRLPPLRPLALHLGAEGPEARVVSATSPPAAGCAGELLVRLHIQSQTWCRERERNRIRTCIACCRRAGSTGTALLPAAGSAALLAGGGGMADPSAAAAGTDGGCCIAMRRAASRWRSSSAFLAWRSSWMRCCCIKTVV